MGFWSVLGKVASTIATPFKNASLIPTIASIGTDVAGSVIQSKAAGSAAAKQTASATESNRMLDESLARSSQAFDPYAATGGVASSQLKDLMDPSSEVYSSYFGGGPEFKAPNPADVLNNPAIKFQLEEGEKAIQRSAASRGSLLSGGTLKSLNRYAQGVAAQGYNDLFARSAQEYGLHRAAFEGTRATRLDQLNRALQTGFGATTGRASLDTAVAEAKGDNLQGAANVNAASTVSRAKTWSDLLANSVGSVVDLFDLSGVNKKEPEQVIH